MDVCKFFDLIGHPTNGLNDWKPTMNNAPALTLSECDRLVAAASQLQDGGDWLGAERLLRQALNAFPAHAQGLHLAGILAHVSGRTELGLGLIERAIESNPQVGVFHANAGEMSRLLGRRPAAIAAGRKAVELDPHSANAWSNLGIALYDNGQHDEAEQCHARALALVPAHPGSLNNLGSIWHGRGDDAKAIEFYEAALRANPSQVDALNNLGSLLMNRKRYLQAVVHLEAAVGLRGTHLGALCNLARTYCAMGKAAEAAPLLRVAAQLAPEDLHVLWASACYYRSIGELELALSTVSRGQALHPGARELGLLRFHLLAQLDRVDEAIGELTTAIRGRDAPDKGLISSLAALLGIKGHGAAVIELLEPLREVFPGDAVLCNHRAMAQKVVPDSAVWAELSGIDGPGAFDSQEEKIYYHFAMAKSLDDMDRPAEAFAHYGAACKLKRSESDYRVEFDEQRFRSLANRLDAGLISRLAGSGHMSDAPIFIVGMMRSGTSLMEQILASHPAVYGAGELMDFGSVLNEVMILAGQTELQPDQAVGAVDPLAALLDPARLQAWGAQYLERVSRRAGAGTVRRFTDKMPLNFMMTGLIHLVFPNAKIIHMKRDPLDTCWSCYTQLFAAAHPFTFDLAEMGRYYRAYENLMAHWRSVLPRDVMLEVSYEELVDNQEQVSRQVLTYCGLEWSEACLQFHKTERSVRTASQYQVKQPMNKRSVLRSRKYEPMLGELIAALRR